MRNYELPISTSNIKLMEVITVGPLVVFTKKIEVKNPKPKIPTPEELSGELEWRLGGSFSSSFTDLKEGTYEIAFHGKGWIGEILVQNFIMYGILEFDRSFKFVRIKGFMFRRQMVSFLLIFLALIALLFVSGFSNEAIGIVLFVVLYFIGIYWVESRRYSNIVEIAAQRWEQRSSD
jgi:hypothetical protein